MVAFQKPITYQGSVTANSTTRTRSTAPKPPGESATTASQIRPAIVSPTLEKNSDRPPGGQGRGRGDRDLVAGGAFEHEGALRVFLGVLRI